jgi:spore coat polysaccharide biosynthesis protein SpsF
VTTAVIIQARMGSTRLPGKTELRLGDRSVLAWVVTRVGLATAVDEIIVATTTGPEDDVIEQEVATLGAACVRGSSDDVLDRYRTALDHTSATTVVRVTADCPFIEPGIISDAVRALEAPGRPDYASTGLDGRYARGLDVEAMRRTALETAAAKATAPDEREHVTLHIYRRPEQFNLVAVPAPPWARRPDLRFTLDEPADFDLIVRVVDGLGATPDSLTGPEVVAFLDSHPEVAALNRSVRHRTVT